jgi:hypothetical protein
MFVGVVCVRQCYVRACVRACVRGRARFRCFHNLTLRLCLFAQVEGELIFALKMLMCTVDQLTDKHKEPRRSRKEVLEKLFNGPKLRGFQVWKEQYAKAKEESGEQGIGIVAGEGGEHAGQGVGRRIDGLAKLYNDLHSESMAEIRVLGDQVAIVLFMRAKSAC